MGGAEVQQLSTEIKDLKVVIKENTKEQQNTMITVARMAEGLKVWQETRCEDHSQEIKALRTGQDEVKRDARNIAVKVAGIGATLTIVVSMVTILLKG